MTRLDPAPLAAMLPELERPGASFGHWLGGEREPDGSIQMPWFDYSPLALRYMEAVSAGGFIVPSFDWMRWLGTSEAIALRDEPGRVERASLLELAHLLTAIHRGDRFSEGEIAGAFASGLIVRMVRRIRTLAAP